MIYKTFTCTPIIAHCRYFVKVLSMYIQNFKVSPCFVPGFLGQPVLRKWWFFPKQCRLRRVFAELCFCQFNQIADQPREDGPVNRVKQVPVDQAKQPPRGKKGSLDQ